MRYCQPGEVVAVWWVDAIIRPEAAKGDNLAPPNATTYGEVVEHTEAYIAVAHERFTSTEVEGEYRGVTTIPSGMILDISRLRPDDE